MSYSNRTVTFTTKENKTTYTSLYTWVHNEARECVELGFDADMFAGYMTQWISIPTLKTVISRETYNNMKSNH